MSKETTSSIALCLMTMGSTALYVALACFVGLYLIGPLTSTQATIYCIGAVGLGALIVGIFLHPDSNVLIQETEDEPEDE